MKINNIDRLITVLSKYQHDYLVYGQTHMNDLYQDAVINLACTVSDNIVTIYNALADYKNIKDNGTE